MVGDAGRRRDGRRRGPVRPLRRRRGHRRRPDPRDDGRHRAHGDGRKAGDGSAARRPRLAPSGGDGPRRGALHLRPLGPRQPRLHRHLGRARGGGRQPALRMDSRRVRDADALRLDHGGCAHGQRCEDPGGRHPGRAHARGGRRDRGRAQRGHLLRPGRPRASARHQPFLDRPRAGRPQRLARGRLRLSRRGRGRERPPHPGHLRPGLPAGGRQLLRRLQLPHDVYVRDGLAFLSHWDAGLIILDVGNGMAGGSPAGRSR